MTHTRAARRIRKDCTHRSASLSPRRDAAEGVHRDAPALATKLSKMGGRGTPYLFPGRNEGLGTACIFRGRKADSPFFSTVEEPWVWASSSWLRRYDYASGRGLRLVKRTGRSKSAGLQTLLPVGAAGLRFGHSRPVIGPGERREAQKPRQPHRVCESCDHRSPVSHGTLPLSQVPCLPTKKGIPRFATMNTFRAATQPRLLFRPDPSPLAGLDLNERAQLCNRSLIAAPRGLNPAARASCRISHGHIDTSKQAVLRCSSLPVGRFPPCPDRRPRLVHPGILWHNEFAEAGRH